LYVRDTGRDKRRGRGKDRGTVAGEGGDREKGRYGEREGRQGQDGKSHPRGHF